MCIKQCEKPLTIGFCQANKNRNVIPVRVDTDQSSPSVSHWLPSFHSWQKLTLTIWKEDSVSSIIQIFQSLILVWDPNTPFMSRVALPAREKPAPRKHWNIHAGLFLLQGFFFFLFSYYISDATLCKFIWLNYSLIEIKSLKHRSAWASSYSLKHL